MSELRLPRARDYPKCECWPDLDPEAHVVMYHPTYCSVRRKADHIKELRGEVVGASWRQREAQIALIAIERSGGKIASREWNKAAGVHQEALWEWESAIDALMEAKADLLPAGEATK